MMKLLRGIGIFSLTVIFCSCEKVIQLGTKNVAKKYVIEANMSDQPSDCTVFITNTINMDDPTLFKGVNGAIVTIREDEKPPVQLGESGPGIYESDFLTAKPGHSYTLNVNIEGENYTSTVTTPVKVNLDSLFIIDFDAFGSVRKFANLVFQDPAGVPNSYRFIQFKNEVQNSNIFVMNDDFSDGNKINTFLTFFDDSDVQKIQKGDTITVEMQCVDPSVYLYFNSLSQSSTGGTEIAAPGNPVSNIKGGALGYFNAFTKQQKTIIVK